MTAEFRRAEANGYDLSTVLPRVVTSRGLADAHDIGAVLISRLHPPQHDPSEPAEAASNPTLSSV